MLEAMQKALFWPTGFAGVARPFCQPDSIHPLCRPCALLFHHVQGTTTVDEMLAVLAGALGPDRTEDLLLYGAKKALVASLPH